MPHAVTDTCRDTHCHHHNEDEFRPRKEYWYRHCQSCRHLYRTPADLLNAYKRWMQPQLLRQTRSHRPEPLPQPYHIRFCPLCARDF